jgi:hypothetical protein
MLFLNLEIVDELLDRSKPQKSWLRDGDSDKKSHTCFSSVQKYNF